MLVEPPIFVVFFVAVAAPLIAPQAGLLRWPLPPRRDPAPLARSSTVASPGLVVVIANVGLKSGHPGSDIAQALIGAALLPLLAYPTAARAAGAGAGRHPGRGRDFGQGVATFLFHRRTAPPTTQEFP